MPAKQKPRADMPPPPPRDDEPTGAAGVNLVAFIGALIRHHLPIAAVEAEIERATGPGEMAGHLEESRPIGMLARRLADRLVADMESSTPIESSDDPAS